MLSTDGSMCHELAQIYDKDRMWTIKETIFAAGGLKSSVIYYDNILTFPRKLCRAYLPESSTGSCDSYGYMPDQGTTVLFKTQGY